MALAERLATSGAATDATNSIDDRADVASARAGIDLLLAAGDQGERAILLGAVTAAGALLGERALALRLDDNELRPAADSDDGAPIPQPLRLERHPSLARALSRPGAGLPEAIEDPELARMLGATDEGAARVLAIPLRAGGRPLGLLAALAGPPLDEEALVEVERVARLAGALLDRAEARSERARMAQELLDAREASERALAAAHHRLEKLDHLTDAVLAVSAHELRAPLEAIEQHAIRLATEPLGDDGRARLEQIRRQARAIGELLDEVLAARKSRSDGLELRPRELELRPLLERCLEEMALAAEGAEVRLELSVGDEARSVYADGAQLRKAVINLVANALAAARPGGRVRVAAAAEAGEVRISVEDDGRGLAPEQLARVLERARALPLASFESGRRLGLAIVREIVERHGGRLSAESAPGEGARFWFTLPRARPGAEPRAGRRVLLVEDDPHHAEIVAAVLAQKGYRVDIAVDGADGVQRARERRPDLIVLDVQMPAVDGFTAAERLKRDARTRDVPILFLSAVDETGSKVRGLQLGAVDYLNKPFHALELLARVERAMRPASASEEPAPPAIAERP